MVPRKRFKLPQIINLWCFVPGKRFRWNQFYVSEIKHGGGRSSDSSAQVLRNSRLEFRLLPPSQHYVLQISFRGRSERMPRERIAKHLSERAPTPPAAMLTTETTFATLCSSDIVLWPSAHDWNNRPELMSDSKDNLHIMLSRFFKVLKIKLKSISLFLFINLFKLIFAVIK